MIAGARFFQFASTMILFGSSLFYLYGFDGPYDARWPRRLLACAAIVALLSLIAWIMLQAAMFGAPFDTALLGSMLTETGFGRVLGFRLAAAAVSCVALLFLWNAPLRVVAGVQAAFGAVLVASFVGVGHAAGGEGSFGAWRSTIDVVHLISSAIWIGALVPLAIMVSRIAHGVSGEAAHAHFALVKFSGIGTAVVLFLVHTGLANAWMMVGGAPIIDLFTTVYGLALIAKIVLFIAMLMLAAANRFWLTPRLAGALIEGGQTGTASALLKLSIFTETGLAVLVLIAVALMGTLEPPSGD